jgi:hypothetical protein
MGEADQTTDSAPQIEIPESLLLKTLEIQMTEPTQRNFSVIQKQNERGLSLILSKTDGAQYDLTTLLPEGYTFIISAKEEKDPVAREIHFNPNRLRYRGSILTMLHEIGHARRDEPDPKLALSTTRKTYHVIKMLPRLFKMLFVSELEHRKLSNFARDLSFTPKLANKILDHRAKAERTAWAEALIMASDLEQQGFNVLGEFGSLKKILEYITFTLSTYEYSMRRTQWILGDPITPGKFTKHAP